MPEFERTAAAVLVCLFAYKGRLYSFPLASKELGFVFTYYDGVNSSTSYPL